MVIWPAFRMGQYGANGHSYHAPQFKRCADSLIPHIFIIPKHCVLGLLWQGIHPFVPSRSRPPLVTLEMKPANKSALKHFAFAASMILSRYLSRIDTWLAAICCEHWTHSSVRAFSSGLQVAPQVTPWSFAVPNDRPKWDDVSIQESNVLYRWLF